MLAALKRHPLPIVAHFEFSLVLTFAWPRAQLEPLLPPGLTPDGHGELGFVAVAMVQTRELRPAFVPRWMGLRFFLTGYRIFARFNGASGRARRGLYILRSDTDRRLMQCFGNALTHYRYHHADIRCDREPAGLRIETTTNDAAADLGVQARLDDTTPALPAASPFTDWSEARRFAGPMPFTFDYEAASNSMILIEGVRENWHPRPVAVEISRLTFFDHAPFPGRPCLASAFYIADIPYRWKRGVREALPPISRP